MTRPRLTDEMLMAYVDGELDADGIARVEAAKNADPSIADRISLFDGSRRALAEGLGAPEPVSDDLLAAIQAIAERHRQEPDPQQEPDQQSSVIPLRKDLRSSVARPAWQLPLAASIALVAGLAAGPFLPWTSTDRGTEVVLTGLDTPDLRVALETVASGDRQTLGDGSTLELIASFQDGAGTLCREFELDQPSGQTLVSVACHQEDSWSLRFAVAAGQANDGFAPASSLEALDAYLAAVEAGEPLSVEAEREALGALVDR